MGCPPGSGQVGVSRFGHRKGTGRERWKEKGTGPGSLVPTWKKKAWPSDFARRSGEGQATVLLDLHLPMVASHNVH